MKKLAISAALCAMMGMSAVAGYQVYDIKLTANTTKGKGTVESCSDEAYCYRDKSKTVIKGVLGGCGCASILANGTCTNAILYMWDETHKLPITNVTTKTGWRVQRIAKKQNVVEHFIEMTAVYGPSNEYRFSATLAGFGTYAENAEADASYVKSISGGFTGLASAPTYLIKGSCSACSSTPDTVLKTQAFALCDECEEASATEGVTPFYGTYTVKFNSSKGKNASKKGVSAVTFKLPAYVDESEFAATNIAY